MKEPVIFYDMPHACVLVTAFAVNFIANASM